MITLIRWSTISVLLAVWLSCRILTAFAQDAWLMKAHDTRRAGQSNSNGPFAVTNSWVAEAPAASVINIGATVTDNGVFFGSWGLLRKDSLGRDVRFWDKADGKLYGLDLATGHPLWDGPLNLDLTHRCYDFSNRQRTGDSVLWCGLGNPYHVSFYNGTVEGQAAVDPARHVLYLGRGDGKLYAIDPDAGKINWRFETFNPELPDDPDGGGEVVSAPLIGTDGTVYFGAWGVGPYETNAIYAVNPDSSLQWRYPTESSLSGRPIFAASALSPDNSTIYFGTFFDGDKQTPAKLYALNLSPSGVIPDQDRLKWELELRNNGVPAWTTTLAVGSDGTIYVGGLSFDSNGANLPVLLAVDDSGTAPVLKWSPQFTGLRDGAQWVGGVALREVNGQTLRLYAVTSNFRATPIFQTQKEEGTLYAIAPATGNILASYDPSEDVPAAVGGLNSPAIGADGIIYFGVRGKFETNTVPAVNGQVFAVEYDESASMFNKLWNFEVEGHLEWNHPAIGPDGGIYVGSSVGAFTDLNTYEGGEVPPNTTCKFYAIKGPVNPVSVEEPESLPDKFRLSQNYPNPFNPETVIEYRLPRTSDVEISVFNVKGQKVATLVKGYRIAGSHKIIWNGMDENSRQVANGVYLYHLRAGRLVAVRKMALLR